MAEPNEDGQERAHEIRAPGAGEPRSLEDAIAQASVHLGVAGRPAPQPPAEETLGPSGRPRTALVVALTATVAAAALLSLPHGAPPAAHVEEELRWAVAQVVRRVEEVRTTQGRLPEPRELTGLLNDAVQYERFEGGYLVTGKAWSVEVTYDGLVPLEQWLAAAEAPPVAPTGGGR